ncbi:MAG: carbohydrate-binding family 9-like protein [Armatimonadia bacterium]
MRHSHLWLIVLALLAAAVAMAAPSTTAVAVSGEVKLDGLLDEPAWSAATWQTNFLSASPAASGAPKPVDVQTRFKVLYDQNAVYVGVECDEPALDKLQARYKEHDGDVYQDDCVEVFFDPAGEGRYYHHFVVNTNGAWYDDYGADYGLVHAKLWEIPLQVGTTVDKEKQVWRVEVRIPLAGLTLKEDAGADWLWNITRERYTTGKLELMTWAPLKGNFHAPKLFGKLAGVKVDFKRFNFGLTEPQVTITGDGSGNHLLRLQTTVSNDSPTARRVVLSAGPFLQGNLVVSEPMALAPGAQQQVTLPPLKVKGNARAALVQFTVADAASGEPYKIAVKHLDSEYRPIAVKVLKPNYRQNIYATETLPELVFEIALAPDVAQKTAQVVYSLHDAQGKPVREGKVAAGKLGEAQKLEVGKLPVGAYELRLRALDKGQGTIIDHATTIRKLGPATGTEVRVDGKRNVVVNGKPTVFCGWYGGIPVEDPRAEVVALQNIQTPVVLIGMDPKPVREAFEKHGVYSIVSIAPGNLYHTFSWWKDRNIKLHQEISTQDEPSAEFVGYLKQLVDCVKSEPGLLGYYLADEPEINDSRSAYLESVYRIMQELDPYHPVMITNDTLDGIVTHGYKACDILSPDPYSSAYDYVPNFMKRCLEVATPGQALMVTPWASCGQTHFTTEWGTAPPYPYKVMRNQYLVSLAFGARGFTGYTTAFFMPEPILRYGLPPIWREVRFLEAALANTMEKPKVEADSEMASWLGQANGHTYMIVVNHKAGDRTAKISHPLLAKAGSLYVVGEARQVKVSGGGFSDKFEDGDARIYTTDPAGQKLQTLADVEKEIAAQEAACLKPGNLLHVSRGVRARSAEGYFAPWFTQYYYYAINGITDDMGWYLSHTDKPSWLELTLPKEEKIGWLVLYSPNLKDYDLQLQAADGTIYTAEIRGNFEKVATHSFAAPVPALKVRVTAIATREGTEPKRPQLSEIEAYAEPAGNVVPLKQQAVGPAATFTAPAAETGGEQVLWREDFTNFRTDTKYNWDGKDDKWVFSPEKLFTQAQPGGGLVMASNSAEGWAGMTHIFPTDKDHRYFQVKISKIEGEGYKWASISYGSSSGKPGYRGGVQSLKPGIYTVDTHYVHESFRDGSAKTSFVNVSSAGSGKNADGPIRMGPKFTYDWLQQVRRPVDGLIVTMVDGSPLPETLRAGDELLSRVYLEKPAVDVTVEALVGSNYNPVLVNGEPYVQLLKAGAKDGREWAATVKLGAKTTKFDARKGYPLMLRAVVNGGAIKDTMQTVAVGFEG